MRVAQAPSVTHSRATFLSEEGYKVADDEGRREGYKVADDEGRREGYKVADDEGRREGIKESV